MTAIANQSARWPMAIPISARSHVQGHVIVVKYEGK